MSMIAARYPEDTLKDLRSPSLVSFLDLARWIAAAMVFVGHLRNPLFVGYGAAAEADRTALVKAWYYLTGWHAEAVVVFFVLSGYLVGGATCARLWQGSFDIRSYAIDRLTRLYVPLIPVLVLTLALDTIGANWFAASGFWDHTQPQIREKIPCCVFSDDATAGLFVSNLLMLQTVLTHSLGSNQPLWTISLEFWFYVVAGIAARALAATAPAWKALGLAMSLALVVLLGPTFQLGLGLWLIGAGCGLMPWRAVERPWLALAAFVAVLVAARNFHNELGTLREAKNYAVALSFGWLLVSMRQVHSRRLEQLGVLNKFMADFSYSLYLLHMPLMFFLLGALHATGVFPGIARGYGPADAVGLALYGGTIAVVYLAAWLFSLATERQTYRLRSWLKRAARPAIA